MSSYESWARRPFDVVAGPQVGADEALVGVRAVRLERDQHLERGRRPGELVARRAGEVRVGKV